MSGERRATGAQIKKMVPMETGKETGLQHSSSAQITTEDVSANRPIRKRTCTQTCRCTRQAGRGGRTDRPGPEPLPACAGAQVPVGAVPSAPDRTPCRERCRYSVGAAGHLPSSRPVCQTPSPPANLLISHDIDTDTDNDDNSAPQKHQTQRRRSPTATAIHYRQLHQHH